MQWKTLGIKYVKKEAGTVAWQSTNISSSLQMDVDAVLEFDGFLAYTVKFTALDAVSLGYKTYLIEDGLWGVNLTEGDVDNAIVEMKKAGVKGIMSSEI